jgi:hypothetical protein
MAHVQFLSWQHSPNTMGRGSGFHQQCVYLKSLSLTLDANEQALVTRSKSKPSWIIANNLPVHLLLFNKQLRVPDFASSNHGQFALFVSQAERPNINCYCYYKSGLNLILVVAWQQPQLLHPQSSCTCAQTVPPRTHHDST